MACRINALSVTAINDDFFPSAFTFIRTDAISRRLEAIADIMELQATDDVRTLSQELKGVPF